MSFAMQDMLSCSVTPRASQSSIAVGMRCERIPTLGNMARRAEEIEGTNGIGTCIAEERPITVHRSQHFRSRHINSGQGSYLPGVNEA